MTRSELFLFTMGRSNAASVFSLMLLAVSLRVVLAQQPTTSALAPTTPKNAADSSVSQTDERYRIGPGDVIEVRVFNRPQLSREAVRVDGRGMIRMPLIEDEIQAACQTESELAREIATRYLKYQKNPQVDVFVREFNSQPVAVIGAVNQPGRFQLQRRVRLLELLTFVGGPSERAGRSIQVVHTAPASFCERSATTASDQVAGADLVFYSLSDALKGDSQSNPYVQPGDIITLPEAEQVFVVGNVLRPAPIALKEPLTVTRAIAMAGGTMPDTKSERVRIIRQLPGSTTKTELFVDLKAIDKRQAADLALQAGDIVDVPTSGGKRLLRSLLGTIVPTATQLPVQVIR